MIQLAHYFTDSVLRAPMIGSLLVGISTSLVGVLLFLKRRSLLGEALSHASYPGVILGIAFFAMFFSHLDQWDFAFAIGGAFVFSYLGFVVLNFLERKWKVHSDAALCFVLSSFFGLGLLFAGQVQFHFTRWYVLAQSYLYGQVVTMNDTHILFYAGFSLVVSLVIVALYSKIQAVFFDRVFAQAIGVPVGFVEKVLLLLSLFAIVVGIRCVGIILISAMLIAPALCARQYTHRLSWMFVIAAIVGVLCCFSGVVLSHELSLYYTKLYKTKVSLPPGPMIVLTAVVLSILSLLFAPRRGLFFRYLRILHFRNRCMRENILKGLWKQPSQSLQFSLLKKQQGVYSLMLFVQLFHLRRQKQIWRKKWEYGLTSKGKNKASLIVRLHRLWEVYLTSELGVDAKQVHHSAEEIEHILTEEMEQKLTSLLSNPTTDPHKQPIPKRPL